MASEQLSGVMKGKERLTWPDFVKRVQKLNGTTYIAAMDASKSLWEGYKREYQIHNPEYDHKGTLAKKRKERTAAAKTKRLEEFQKEKEMEGKKKEREPSGGKKELPEEDGDYDYVTTTTTTKKRKRNVANDGVVTSSAPPPKPKRKRTPQPPNYSLSDEMARVHAYDDMKAREREAKKQQALEKEQEDAENQQVHEKEPDNGMEVPDNNTFWADDEDLPKENGWTGGVGYSLS
jgi:hypothetical protein